VRWSYVSPIDRSCTEFSGRFQCCAGRSPADHHTAQGLHGRLPRGGADVVSARLLALSVRELTARWCSGDLDSFTYLCAINHQAGRLTCNLMQFPIFPSACEPAHILVTRPTGQLDTSRAQEFDGRDDAVDSFYGTHYLRHVVVLHYRARLNPFCYFLVMFDRAGIANRASSAPLELPSDRRQRVDVGCQRGNRSHLLPP
jgi:hypothetical protein